jgi:hypothetical protein
MAFLCFSLWLPHYFLLLLRVHTPTNQHNKRNINGKANTVGLSDDDDDDDMFT